MINKGQLLLIIFLLMSSAAHSQLFYSPTSFQNDSNYITFSSSKVQEIYNFSEGFNIGRDTKYGYFQAFQEYVGQGTPLSDANSYQESQLFRFKYSYNINDNFQIINKNNWFISSNTLSFGLNKLERINFAIGGRYFFDEDFFLQSIYGYERNTASGIETDGKILESKFSLDNLNLEGFDIRSNGFGEIVTLNDGRENTDIRVNLNTYKPFDDNSNILFSIGYNIRNRDNPEINPNVNEVLLRRRLQNSFRISSILNFVLFDEFYNELSIAFDNQNINNRYNSFYTQLTETGTNRQVDIFTFDINYRTIYRNSFSRNIFNVFYSQNQENYSAQNIYDLSDEEFQLFVDDQNKQDRDNTNLRLSQNSNFILTNSDSLNISSSIEIFRYDTPSDRNNDDRDELSINSEIEYLRRINKNIHIGLGTEIRLHHYVYLKAQRSASNNWNRIIRLFPTIILNYNKFYYKPKFGINANYTVYDFENQVNGISSFSFREISYSDTLSLELSDTYTIQSKNLVRYSERGILYWDEFAETPERSNLEVFSNLMFFNNFNNMSSVGLGIRYYKRNDSRINSIFVGTSAIINDFESIAPEVKFIYTFETGNSLNLDAWYEFQTINLKQYREVPNFYLTAKILI